jgi:hypothetical protein
MAKNLDLNILNVKKIILTDEEIEKYKKRLMKAEPYTQEDVDNIPFDTLDYDWDRMDAYDAKKALEQAGLL